MKIKEMFGKLKNLWMGIRLRDKALIVFLLVFLGTMISIASSLSGIYDYVSFYGVEIAYR